MQIDPATYSFQSPSGFIVLEGVNGAGKSSLQKKLAEQVRNFGKIPLETRQPGGSPLGAKIRKLLLEESEERSHLAELMLFAADRAEHVTKVINPALAAKEIVLCDRYSYSTTAFQGYGRELDLELVNTINSLAVQDCLPDLVILLDLEPEVGLKRTKSRGHERDSFEEEELAFHHRLRDGFLNIAQEVKEPFLIVDASQSEEEVYEYVRPVFQKLLEEL
ncbi:MAG: dTMP kinase [Bdellovibrionales bacterium]|nr:dTMP kinase [Bdellovibrionales bacterium]